MSESLPSAQEVLAEIDARYGVKPRQIPHSPHPSSPLPTPIHSAPATWMRTEVYLSHRIKYVRFRWGKGSETWGYVHIAGGSHTNELVQHRRAQIDAMIVAHCDLLDILELLRSFENARAGRKPPCSAAPPRG